MEAAENPAGVLSFILGSDGSKAEILILPGGSRYPPSQNILKDYLQYLIKDGNAVFKIATRILGKALQQAKKEANLKSEDIDLFIPHQANKRIIISAAAKQARLPKEKIFINKHKFDNISAASIPIALFETLDEGYAKIGDTLAFVAFGARLTWASAVTKLFERDIPEKSRKWLLPFINWFPRRKEKKV